MALPASLLREGLLMRDALLADFSQLENIDVVTTCDARLAEKNRSSPAHVSHTINIDASSDAMPVWRELLQSCDAALIVAPETGGVLATLMQMVEDAGVKNLACSPLATAVASNKYDTCQQLARAGILAIPTYTVSEFLQLTELAFQHGYVIKPIDGAGCEDTMYFPELAAAQTWLSAGCNNAEYEVGYFEARYLEAGYIVQPYQPGKPASISMLCRHGQGWLLSCNEQMIVLNGEQSASPAHIQYQGSVVNGLTQHRDAFAELAGSIAAAMPGLNGYVGVDVVVSGNAVHVVEINPRITTSYIALRESIGVNPARLLLDLAYTETLNKDFALPVNMTTKPVAVNLYA